MAAFYQTVDHHFQPKAFKIYKTFRLMTLTVDKKASTDEITQGKILSTGAFPCPTEGEAVGLRDGCRFRPTEIEAFWSRLGFVLCSGHHGRIRIED